MILRYILAGSVNTVAAFVIYAILVQLTPTPFWLANLFVVCLAIISGLLFGKYLVFRESKSKITKVWWKYLAAYGAQYLLSTGLIAGFLMFGASEVVGYVLALPIVVPFGFLAQRFWVFKTRTAAV